MAAKEPIPLYDLYLLPSYTIVSPGLSSIPASMPPSITTFAPAASDFATSPLYLMPPSAIIGISYLNPISAQSITAES